MDHRAVRELHRRLKLPTIIFPSPEVIVVVLRNANPPLGTMGFFCKHLLTSRCSCRGTLQILVPFKMLANFVVHLQQLCDRNHRLQQLGVSILGWSHSTISALSRLAHRASAPSAAGGPVSRTLRMAAHGSATRTRARSRGDASQLK